MKLDRIKEKLKAFDPALKTARDTWAGFALREKIVVGIGGACLAIFLVYQLWWSPINTALFNLRKRLVAQQKTLAFMQSADKEIMHLQKESHPQEKSETVVSLLSGVQKQITQKGLQSSLTQLKQASNDSIEIHFQKVEFDKLIVLLEDIIKKHTVALTQMSVMADESPGLVSADIFLKIIS